MATSSLFAFVPTPIHTLYSCPDWLPSVQLTCFDTYCVPDAMQSSRNAKVKDTQFLHARNSRTCILKGILFPNDHDLLPAFKMFCSSFLPILISPGFSPNNTFSNSPSHEIDLYPSEFTYKFTFLCTHWPIFFWVYAVSFLQIVNSLEFKILHPILTFQMNILLCSSLFPRKQTFLPLFLEWLLCYPIQSES